MRTTIDAAGRLVVPKTLRDQLGLTAGEVELTVDGAALRVQAIAGEDTVMEHGFLVIPPAGLTLDDDDIRTLRDAHQR